MLEKHRQDCRILQEKHDILTLNNAILILTLTNIQEKHDDDLRRMKGDAGDERCFNAVLTPFQRGFNADSRHFNTTGAAQDEALRTQRESLAREQASAIFNPDERYFHADEGYFNVMNGLRRVRSRRKGRLRWIGSVR